MYRTARVRVREKAVTSSLSGCRGSYLVNQAKFSSAVIATTIFAAKASNTQNIIFDHTLPLITSQLFSLKLKTKSTLLNSAESECISIVLETCCPIGWVKQYLYEIALQFTVTLQFACLTNDLIFRLIVDISHYFVSLTEFVGPIAQLVSNWLRV